MKTWYNKKKRSFLFFIFYFFYFIYLFLYRERVVNFHSTWVRPKEITSDWIWDTMGGGVSSTHIKQSTMSLACLAIKWAALLQSRWAKIAFHDLKFGSQVWAPEMICWIGRGGIGPAVECMDYHLWVPFHDDLSES